MHRKLIRISALFWLLNVILASCGGSSPGRTALSLATEAPAATEAPTSIEETLIETLSTDEPAFTKEPTSTEDLATLTPELTSTEELIPLETPPVVSTLEEPAVTGEPTEENTTATEDPGIEPAEGFWAVSDGEGQLVTVSPVDWFPTGNTEFFNEDWEEVGGGFGVSTLVSPDNKAFMCFMAYHNDAITEWHQALAQEKALLILNKLHTKGTEDVRVISVQPMPDGSERLSWSSKVCDCSGIIAYKAGPPIEGTVEYPKNRLWLFDTFYVNSYKNNYIDIFNYAFELLTFPPEISRINP